jgi:hypothetical protein
MYQTEIQFFWPLTEQIPLDLDYTGCVTKNTLKYNASLAGGTGVTFTHGNGTPVWTTSINVDANTITVTSKNLPPLHRRLLYKLLGINWRQS